MHKSSQLIREQSQSGFIKGMTLDQYMSNNTFKPTPEGEDQENQQEQNLFQSSRNRKIEGIKSKNSQYFIDQIDQQSMQDSIENLLGDQSPCIRKNQKTKETLVQNAERNQNPWKARVNSISMNATAFFKSSQHQKNAFRIKHMSVSPYKKKSENPIQNGSITLYGSKFGHNINKNIIKMPQMVTFYGKLNHNNDQHNKKDNLNKNAFKKKQSKRNFQKKNQLQINQLIEYQSKIKNNYSHKNYIQQIKIQGIKDKFIQRKNKFC